MADFNPEQFVNRLGRRLISEFEDAAEAGTPGLVGAAREHPARSQLAKLLPNFVSVGSGLLFDSYGGSSKQQDIVVYERDFCPVFSINDTPDSTFYPIETVVSVGEVKSTVSKAILFEALANASSAKALRRHADKADDGLGPMFPYRNFGSPHDFAAAQPMPPGPSSEYNQTSYYRDQIFSFILCHKFAQSAETVLDNLLEYRSKFGHSSMPNLILSLTDGFIQGASIGSKELQQSLEFADSIAFVPAPDRAFSYLVHALKQHARLGRTVSLSSLDRYITSTRSPLPSSIFRAF